jgi:Mg2+ and Co2+ transporter CorA
MDSDIDQLDNANLDKPLVRPKKVGWLKKLLFVQPEIEYTEQHHTTAKESRKLNQYLTDIEKQIGKVDEKNNLLMQTLSTLKDNNELLLKQINTLSEANKQLFAKMQASNKRARIAKIIAIIASIVTITVGVLRITNMI